jgi:hypothetical protein
MYKNVQITLDTYIHVQHVAEKRETFEFPNA